MCRISSLLFLPQPFGKVLSSAQLSSGEEFEHLIYSVWAGSVLDTSKFTTVKNCPYPIKDCSQDSSKTGEERDSIKHLSRVLWGNFQCGLM